MLPRPRLCLLICRETLELRGQGPSAARWPQPHIHLVECPIIGLGRKRVDKPLGKSGKILRAIQGPRSIRFRESAVKIIDEDEVKVGRCGHFVAAQLAQGHHCRLFFAHVPMRAREVGGDRAMHGADNRICQTRERLPSLPRGDSSCEDPYTDQEDILEAEHAYALEQVLVIARLSERRIKSAMKLVLIRQSAKKTRVNQRIDHLGVACQRITQTWCNAENKND